MIRSVLAVLAGLATFVIALSAMLPVIAASMRSLYPETASSESVIDSGGIASVLWLVWETASMVAAGYVAARIAPRLHIRHALIVGALQAVMTMWAMFAVREASSPLWFWIIGIAAMVPAAWFGATIRTRQAKVNRALAI